jgi:hypothetical protein
LKGKEKRKIKRSDELENNHAVLWYFGCQTRKWKEDKNHINIGSWLATVGRITEKKNQGTRATVRRTEK